MATPAIVTVREFSAEIDPGGKSVDIAIRDAPKLRFEIDRLQPLVQFLSGIVARTVKQRRKQSTRDEIVTAIPAVGFRANASMESDQIVLALQSADGLEHNFSILTSEADRVCNEIQKASLVNKSRPRPTVM